MSDGAFPSNEGRGYILRKILRRAQRHYMELGMKEPYLYMLIDEVIKMMGGIYPELKGEKRRVSKIIKSEEEKFLQTLEVGLKHIENIFTSVKKSGNRQLPGEEVFRL